jgi:hypothetical protein
MASLDFQRFMASTLLAMPAPIVPFSHQGGRVLKNLA